MNITVNPSDNTLRFAFIERTDSARERTLPATIDIGEEGRLLGVELEVPAGERPRIHWPPAAADLIAVDDQGESCYLAIESGPATEALTRSVRGTVRIATDENGLVAEVILPRRGAGYEITYPSGNR